MELSGTTAFVSGGASGLIGTLNLMRLPAVAEDIGGRFARTDVSDEQGGPSPGRPSAAGVRPAGPAQRSGGFPGGSSPWASTAA